MPPLDVSQFMNPAAWPHAVGEVKMIETHTAWVFLTGELAYKIKKPVNFGFLDFSSLEKREHCCREELRLNRRLAPDLYLEVLPVTGTPAAPRLGGDGAAIDYAVKMRQFDTRAGFDELARRGEVTAAHIDRAAEVLAGFHDRAAVADTAGDYGTAAATAYPVLENFEQIAPNLPHQASDFLPLFEDLERWSRSCCRTLEAEFAARLEGGFVRECHGDLHLRNIVLWRGEVVPFDCLEFNPSLRWIDVMSELAFLLMDLDDHGLAPLARRLLNAYLEHTGDYRGLVVLRFYQVYRAMVRAKVESLRLAQLDHEDAAMRAELRKYLRLADSYTAAPRPRLLIAHGLSGSGKTFVSQRLLEAAGLVRLRSDVERKRLFGIAPLESSGSDRDAGIYSLAANTETYQHLLAQAEALLDTGWPVLVDAAFLKREEREAFRKLAQRLNVPFAIMHCEAEMAVQRQRVAARRGDASEADIAVLELQLEREEPLAADEQVDTINVDTTDSPGLEELLVFLA